MTFSADRVKWLRSASAVLFVLIAGCKEPSSGGVDTSVEQQAVARTEQPTPTTNDPAASTTVVSTETQSLHRVRVVAGGFRDGNEAIANAMSEALRKRGLQVMDRLGGQQPTNIVVVWGSARSGGAWGGLPMQQVMLRYALLDAVGRTRIETGVDSASFADPTIASARQGALRKAADSLARRMSVTLSRLPAPAALLPAPPPPSEPVISVAALPFRNATGRPELTGWCETLATVATQELTASTRYRVVERTRLTEVLKEGDLSAALGASPDVLSQMGRQLNVELLLVGEVASRPDGQLAITARLVRASNAQVEQTIIAADSPARTVELEAQFRRQLPKRAVDWVAVELDRLRRMPEAWPVDPGR